jgi:hypothetical protein
MKVYLSNKMSSNFKTRIQNDGFTEQYNELDGKDQGEQQCSWTDGKSDDDMDIDPQSQTVEENTGPSYVHKVEQLLDKMFSGITLNSDPHTTDKRL